MIGVPPGPVSTVGTVGVVGAVGGLGTHRSKGSHGAEAPAPTAPDAHEPKLEERAERQDLDAPGVRRPPLTGDVELDAAMGELARAQSQSFSERIASGERVHRLLQGRLGDLGRA